MDLLFVLGAGLAMGFIMFGTNTYAQHLIAKRKAKKSSIALDGKSALDSVSEELKDLAYYVASIKNLEPVNLEESLKKVRQIGPEPVQIKVGRELHEKIIKAISDNYVIPPQLSETWKYTSVTRPTDPMSKIPNPCGEIASNGIALDGLSYRDANIAMDLNLKSAHLRSLRKLDLGHYPELDDWFRMESGTFKIRILPQTYFGLLSDWFVARRQHYLGGFGGGNVVPCNKQYNGSGNHWKGECAICDHHRALWEEIGKIEMLNRIRNTEDQLREYATKTKAVTRYYYNVVDQTHTVDKNVERSMAVKLMSVSPQVHNMIVEKMKDMDIKDISDPIRGCNITIVKSVYGSGYPTFHVSVHKPSPLGSKDEIENALANVWWLSAIVSRGSASNDNMLKLMTDADVGFNKDGKIRTNNTCHHCNKWFQATPKEDSKYCSEECKELQSADDNPKYKYTSVDNEFLKALASA